MSNYSLIEAFIGGHYPTEASPHSPAAHLFRNGNDRDKALIYMLDKQLKYRKKEAESIRRNNNANTNLLLNELENGNRELESLRTGISRLEATNYEGFKAVCDSMEVTNGLLDDISWRLGQAVSILGDIDFKLGKILNVLKQNRKNEAKQLVNQGARLMLYGDYRGAEERFKLAYNFDVTDYQVLMNLGHVELQKQNAQKAKDWYKKASTLPVDIDGYARSLPIWNIARIYYAKGEFEEAYTHAQRASQAHDESLGENLFKVAVYAGLAGHKPECLYGIEGAIHRNPKFFRAAIAHPDLHHIRRDVYRSLDVITSQYNSSIRTKIDKFNSCFNFLKNIDLASVAKSALSNAMSTGQSIISIENFTEKWNFYQINDDLVSGKIENIHLIHNDRNELFNQASAKKRNMMQNDPNTKKLLQSLEIKEKRLESWMKGEDFLPMLLQYLLLYGFWGGGAGLGILLIIEIGKESILMALILFFPLALLILFLPMHLLEKYEKNLKIKIGNLQAERNKVKQNLNKEKYEVKGTKLQGNRLGEQIQ